MHYVMTHSYSINDKNCYVPDETLVRYFAQRLQFEREREKASVEGKSLSKEDELLDQNLRTTKSRTVLPHVYQAMADLLFFFETISASKDLQEIFDKDLEDLLGLDTNTYFQTSDGKRVMHWSDFYPSYNPCIFERLLCSMIFMHKKDLSHYSSKLTPIIQQVVNKKFLNSLPSNLDESMRGIIHSDLERASTWTRVYSNMSETSREAKNIIAFNFSYPSSYPESFRRLAKVEAYNEEDHKRMKDERYRNLSQMEWEKILYKERPELVLEDD